LSESRDDILSQIINESKSMNKNKAQLTLLLQSLGKSKNELCVRLLLKYMLEKSRIEKRALDYIKKIPKIHVSNAKKIASTKLNIDKSKFLITEQSAHRVKVSCEKMGLEF